MSVMAYWGSWEQCCGCGLACWLFAEREEGGSVCHIIIGMSGYYSDRSREIPPLFWKKGRWFLISLISPSLAEKRGEKIHFVHVLLPYDHTYLER
jgi:hypothetical protein